MSLSTDYLGMILDNPLVLSAGPLTRNLDAIRAAEDAGIGAIVMHSLFEEDIDAAKSEAELESFFAHFRAAKGAVKTPIIGSLNGITASGWVDYAAYFEEEGADALELNIYHICADLEVTGAQIDDGVVEIAEQVNERVSIPFSVKLSPFYSSVPNLAKRLSRAGADGLVLFNRFYQPEIDLANLSMAPGLTMSSPFELQLPLRWIALLHGRLPLDFALTSGVHTYEDVLKAVLAGANVAMMTSEILKNGFLRVEEILEQMRRWLAKSKFDTLTEMHGLLSQHRAPDQAALTRANYVRTLRSYEVEMV